MKNRIVIQIMGIGAEFIALTSDGVIHEWNCYDPYKQRLTGINPDLIVPCHLDRPSLIVPVEWTPIYTENVKTLFYVDRA